MGRHSPKPRACGAGLASNLLGADGRRPLWPDPNHTHTFDTGQPRAKARCLSKVLLGTRPDGVTVCCGPAARKHGCWRTGFVLTTRRRCPACKAPGGLRELLPFGTRN